MNGPGKTSLGGVTTAAVAAILCACGGSAPGPIQPATPGPALTAAPLAPPVPAPTPPPAPPAVRASGSVKGDYRYTLADLRALEAQRGWAELVDHLADVPPSARDDAWRGLAERASVELLSLLLTRNEPLRALTVADDLTQRYPTLMASAAFVDKRADVGLRGFEACYDQSPSGVDCTERFLGYVEADPTNYALAMNAGRLVIHKQFAHVAVRFFARAVVGNPNGSKLCADEELRRSVQGALDGLPESHAIFTQAKQIRAICRWR